MKNKSPVKKYGDHWERKKMFTVNNGIVSWTELAWPDEKPPLKGVGGLYVLYRGEKPIYVGVGDPLEVRIHEHTKDWLAPWWDSVCWYEFDDMEMARIVESFMISHGMGLWNGAESGGKYFGEAVYLEGTNFASNELWIVSRGKKENS